MSHRAWLGIYLRGVCMGAADVVPGVSGGTIALITGIYERLVLAITALDAGLLVGLGRIHTPRGRDRLLSDLRESDVGFLLVLGTGIATAVVTLTHLLETALASYPGPTFAFFFGLIAASAVVLAGEIVVTTPRGAGALVVGIIVAFGLSGISASAGIPHTLPVVFLAGAVAVTAMILPGISGAFILLLLGQYAFLVGTVTGFVDGLITVLRGEPAGLLGPAATMATFVAGAAIGLVTVAHAIRWALARYRTGTLTFLVGLMVGALRLPATEVLQTTPVGPVPAAVGPLLAAAVGGGLVLAIEHLTGGISY